MQNWQSKLGRALGVGVGVAAAGAAVIGVGGATLARILVTPERSPGEPVTVTRIDREGERLIVQLRGDHAALPGQYSLLFSGGAGHARLGPVIARSGTEARRELVGIPSGSLEPGTTGRITGWWFTEPEQTGFRTERITYETELGTADAWIIHPDRVRRGSRGRWAVHVHGRGALPAETLRGVAPLARAGITSLVISYRNDPGAPAGEHGRYGIGIAESRDVDAAIAEAVRRGAERVTLVGWSMGGTAVLRSATAGPCAAAVDGIVLDSPAVDWPALLRHQASRIPVPQGLADVGISLLERGVVRGGEAAGIDFESIQPETVAAALTVPVLVHASRGDTFVPSAGAERLAAARPDLVQLHLSRDGEHVKIWNTDPIGWEKQTESFVRALPKPGWRGELPDSVWGVS